MASESWRLKQWSELSRNELYALMVLRQRVFVVEQKSAYLDADGLDQLAWHLWHEEGGSPDSYARLFPPGAKYDECSIGRVVTSPETRGKGQGKLLMLRAMEHVRLLWGNVAIRISAQAYLQRFYEEFGFVRVGEAYLEDDIPHIKMVVSAVADR